MERWRAIQRMSKEEEKDEQSTRNHITASAYVRRGARETRLSYASLLSTFLPLSIFPSHRYSFLLRRFFHSLWSLLPFPFFLCVIAFLPPRGPTTKKRVHLSCESNRVAPSWGTHVSSLSIFLLLLLLLLPLLSDPRLAPFTPWVYQPPETITDDGARF